MIKKKLRSQFLKNPLNDQGKRIHKQNIEKFRKFVGVGENNRDRMAKTIWVGYSTMFWD